MRLMLPLVLLILSNVFMTFAWYGHLKKLDSPLWIAVIVSWGIAFFEYCLQVPANRLGALAGYNTPQLKVAQEAITLVVFCFFAWLYLGETLKWNHYVGFGLVFAAVFFVFHKW